MNRLLIPLLATLALPNAVNADLGKAEIKLLKERTYDVWCEKKYNKCKVTFDDEKMKVNNSKGISSDQIISMAGTPSSASMFFTYTYKITYKKKDGSNAEAKFLIANAKTLRLFKEELRKFTTRKYY